MVRPKTRTIKRAHIRLEISARLENMCKRWCRTWFPDEAYGLLVGTMAGSTVYADGIWTPSFEDGQRYFKRGKVLVQPRWFDEALEDEEGLMIVGDFHSHPYYKSETRCDPVQSETDIFGAANHAVFGICNVEEQRDGSLRTRMCWWGPSVGVDVRRKK